VSSLRSLACPVAALAVVAAAAGCARKSSVDICGRGDVDDLTAALAGGRLELTFVAADGGELLRAEAPADEPSALAVSVPDGAARVEVAGFSSGGELVARGGGGAEGGRACVCFTLADHVEAVCAGVGCAVDGGECRFFDESSGGDASVRTLVLGDNSEDDVNGVAADTTLSSEPGDLDLNFGAAERLRITSEPATTALLRFGLGSLPRAISIERAELELTACEGCAATGAIAAFPVIEAWSEGSEDGAVGCPSWNCRDDGIAWTVPGCGFFSDTNRSREAAAVAQAAVAGPGAATILDVTAAVRDWAASPAANFGLSLLVDEGGQIELASREGPAARPRLRVTFRLDDAAPGLDGGTGDPDAGGDGGVAPEMVAVPQSSFLMGCAPGTESDCEADELPLHAVTLSAFEIDRTEVTQEAYLECLEAGACSAPACDFDPVLRRTYPVTCVTWEQAVDYCAFAGKRLPTEAEWEKAARGTDGRRYPWGDEPPDCARANAFGCAGAPQPVAIHPSGASPFGAHDMAGNASEYVSDRYGAGYYAESPATDPPGPATGNRRVRRGGAFNGGEHAIAVFNRTSVRVDIARANFGFRCAR
jgi:formylglycine-generating enzyme required for sulfatase activity